MQLRPEQVSVFRAKALETHVEVLKDHVRDHFPLQWRFSGEAAVERTIRLLHAHARQVHGIDTRRGLMLYVTVAMLLGSGFDLDPMVPWASRELAGGPRPDAGLADARMDAVADKALIFHERVSGEGNRALYRALIQLNSWPDNIIAALPASVAPEAEILRRLDEAHPVKAGYLGTAKLGALITMSTDVAERCGVTDFPGRALLALLHFMLGAYAHTDPMLPWIGEALSDAPGATARLHARTTAFLADIVSNTPTPNV